MENNEEFGRNDETLRGELHPMDIDEEKHFVARGLLNKSTINADVHDIDMINRQVLILDVIYGSGGMCFSILSCVQKC
jgi:hypothetical protein